MDDIEKTQLLKKVQELKKRFSGKQLVPVSLPPLPKAEKYALFIWVKPLLHPPNLRDMLFGRSEENFEAAPLELPKEQLVFLKLVNSPKEASEIISRNPRERYAILRGEMMEVSAYTHVFADGKNLNTLDNEWL